METFPGDTTGLRACIRCFRIQKMSDFKKYGCANCEDILRMIGSMDRIVDCTTSNFRGMVAVLNQKRSWVSRWLGADKFKNGFYAIKVVGRLPEDVVSKMDDD